MGRPVGFKLSDEARARISAARRALMADPYERARISDTHRTQCAKPTRKQRMSAAATAAWQDPDKAARMGPPRAHLPAMSKQQRAEYRKLRQRHFPIAEALQLLGVGAD